MTVYGTVRRNSDVRRTFCLLHEALELVVLMRPAVMGSRWGWDGHGGRERERERERWRDAQGILWFYTPKALIQSKGSTSTSPRDTPRHAWSCQGQRRNSLALIAELHINVSSSVQRPAAPGVPKTKWELRNPERSSPVPGPVKDKQREGLAREALTDRSQCD